MSKLSIAVMVASGFLLSGNLLLHDFSYQDRLAKTSQYPEYPRHLDSPVTHCAQAMQAGCGSGLTPGDPSAGSSRSSIEVGDRRVRGRVEPNPEPALLTRSDYVPLANISFARLDYAESLRLLTAVLVNSNSDGEILAAIDLLAAVNRRDSFDALSRALAGHYATEVRGRAIEAIGKRGGDTLHYLGQVLLTETDPELLALATDLLERDGSPAALALLRMTTTGINSVAGWPTAVQQSGPPEEPGLGRAFPMANYADRFLEDLNTMSEAEGRAVIRDFAYLEERTELDSLALVLQGNSRTYLKIEALASLQDASSSDALQVAALALGDSAVEVRQRVLQVYAARGEEALSYLGQVMFGHSDIALRRMARDIVTTIDSPAARALEQFNHY